MLFCHSLEEMPASARRPAAHLLTPHRFLATLRVFLFFPIGPIFADWQNLDYETPASGTDTVLGIFTIRIGGQSNTAIHPARSDAE